MKLSAVTVGQRFRKDIGDLAPLMSSISAVGLLHPIVVDSNGNIIAGVRRLTACRKLGWKEIPATVVTLDGAAVAAQRDENIIRKDFLPSEAVAIGRAVEEHERAAAKKRKMGGAKVAPGDKAKTRQRVAAVAGVSHETFKKAAAVVDAAAKDPERYAPVLAQMDETGNVAGAFEVLEGKRDVVTLRSSKSNEWYTPALYIEAVRSVLGVIDLDPASSTAANKTVKAARFFDQDTDGLKQPWQGRVFCNPPYGNDTPAFVSQLLSEYAEGRTIEAILLVNANSTDTQWFRPLWEHTLCFVHGRINYINPHGTQNSSTHGSVFVHLGKDYRMFQRVFSEHGAVVRRVR